MKTNRGLTLIEVLVALAILAIGFLAVMMTYNSSVRATRYIQAKTFAEWVGLDVIARAKVGLVKPTRQGTLGDTNWFQQNWKWRYIEIPTDNPMILRMEVEVRDAQNIKLVTVTGVRNGWMP